MENGWIKLHYRLLGWEWFEDRVVLQVWIYIMLTANYEDKKWRGNIIKRGSFITSYDRIADYCKLTIKQVRRAIDCLIESSQIVKERANSRAGNGLLITICKYDSYQSANNQEGQQLGQQKGIERALEGQQKGTKRASTKEYKNNRIEEGKNIEKEREDTKKEKSSLPFSEIQNLWNTICVSHPKVQQITQARKDKIKSRLSEFTSNPDEYLPFCKELFTKIQRSEFLTKKWRATFDWTFENEKNWLKVMEGNYDNKEQDNPAPDVKLGVGERIINGKRTYGDGSANIPMDAPPRPGDYFYWNKCNGQWATM